MNEEIQKDILHELKIIKKLLAQNILIGETQTKQISKLNSLGFQPKELLKFLAQPPIL